MENKKDGISGKRVHKFLMSESFKELESKGYKAFIEYKLPNNKIADVYGIKDNDVLIIECLVRPDLATIRRKIFNYQGYKFMVAYPSHFIPKFPIESLIDVIKIDIPDLIKSSTITLSISDELWRTLNIMKHPGNSFEEVIWSLIRNQKENNESSNQNL